jgi:hypothetical protein
MADMTMKRERLPRHLVADEPLSLEDLAARANHEHELCEAVSLAALNHAILAGEALTKARERVEPGEWQRWLAKNFAGHMDAARLYVRLATYREQFTPDMSISEAKRLVTGMPVAVSKGSHSPYGTDVRETARTLVKQGVAVAEVARHVEVPEGTIRYWTDPNQKERLRKSMERAQRAREALRKQERDKQIRRAVRQAGAALSEAYAMAERMQDVLAQAEREATSVEGRAALQRAGEHHRRMRDEIVRALGVGS